MSSSFLEAWTRKAKASSSFLEAWTRKAKACAEWGQKYPALAQAWDEAIEEDVERTNKYQAQRWESALIQSSLFELPRMGVPRKSAREIWEEESLPEFARQWHHTPGMVGARKFVSERQPFLLLLGGVGSGKTDAAAWCLLQARASGSNSWEVRLSPSKGAFIYASEAARLPKFDDEGRWDRLLRVQWLVIDEMGTETMTDHWEERVNELINRRYGNELRTIITSNISAVQFKARYKERIASRLRESAVIVDCGKKDLRTRSEK